MAGVVAVLDDEKMQDVAAYYSRQIPQPIPAAADSALLARGKALFELGDWNRHIPACANCHTAGHDFGRRLALPVLQGQHAAYTEAQLHAFRKGTRGSATMMPMIASRLDDDDIQALSAYIASR
ncbi:MAG: c-type cytochrome [Rhodocyclaceae bacterium]